MAQFLFAGVISFRFQAISTDDSFVTNVLNVVVYFQLENGRLFDFLNVVTSRSTYARHSLNARKELSAGHDFFRKT